MKLTGSTNIAAPIDVVWEHLTDAEFVAGCAPGLDSMEVIEPDRKFKALGSIGLGNLKVKFTGDIEFVTLEKPSLAILKGRGTAPGSVVEVTAEMSLSEADDKTTSLDWVAEVNVLGTIAALASRMMTSMAQSLSSQFFDCVRMKIEV